MFGSLLKAVAGVALLPVAVVTDVLTFPAIATEDRASSTVKFLKAIEENLEDAVEPD